MSRIALLEFLQKSVGGFLASVETLGPLVYLVCAKIDP